MHMVSSIIVAGGKGTRFGKPKQFVRVFGRPLLHYTVSRFLGVSDISEIIIVVPHDSLNSEVVKELIALDRERIRAVPGGRERGDSVFNGLKASRGQIILIHDGARPLVTPEIIGRCIKTMQSGIKAATVAIPARDTLKRKSGYGLVEGVINRHDVMQIQTPQCFLREIIMEAYSIASLRQLSATDDSTLVEMTVGVKSNVVHGEFSNFKITFEEDMEMFRKLLVEGLRIGHGYDLHRLAPGRKFVLGGVMFEGVEFGPLGHSDGDALIHAIIDSLLSPCGLGDIGKLFPDTAPEYKDVSSIELLKKVGHLLIQHGCTVLNIDATVKLERPKIGEKTQLMARKIADALSISPSQITIKGKTGEKLGPVGRSEAVEVHAVALIATIK